MNVIRRMMLCLALFFSTELVLASQDVIDCPSASLIANTSFTSVKEFGIGWELLADINYKETPWIVRFIVNLDAVTDTEDALQKGQEYFKNKVTLAILSATGDDKEALCLYAFSADHSVFATRGVPRF